MKYPIGSIALMFTIAMANWPFWQTSQTDLFQQSDSLITVLTEDSDPDQSQSLTSMACPMAAQTVDSLALIDLWNSTGGSSFFWNFPWWNPASDPVCSWFGITTDSEGYVTHIMLSNHGLFGPLPTSIGNFSRLEELRLDNNQLSGSLPTQLGNLSTLEVLYVDDNDFTGSVPSSIGNLTNLTSFFLDNNQLTGRIPSSFVNLTSLQRFELFENQLDSLPDLSGLTTLVSNRFKVQVNKFTFDDLLPNLGIAMGDFYITQTPTICPFSTVDITTGSDYSINLGVDAEVASNVYTWYKDGGPIPIATITGSNKLNLAPVTFSDAGTYYCDITNPNAPLLTLTSCNMTVQVSCGLSINAISDSLCVGQTITVNSTTYSQSNPTDTINFPSGSVDGCDSVIYINLNYPPGEAIGVYRDTICRGDTVFVNGTDYHVDRLFGLDFFSGQSSFGCDSILEIYIALHPDSPAGSFNPSLCRGDTVYYFGEAYYEGKESGTQVIPNPDVNGCDSSVVVNLTFYPGAENTFNSTHCLDDTVLINSVQYFAAQPSGRDTLVGASANGCDSILIINLTFDAFATGDFQPTLCLGDSVTVNGTSYHEGNRTGTETFPNGSVSGCDSILSVAISFYPAAEGHFAPTLCPGDDVTVNGMIYNASNPIDTIILPNASINACDSTVYINLSFHPAAASTYAPDLCPGDSVTINGTIYHEGNRTGTEVISNATANGCDSTVTVNLNYLLEASGSFSTTLCIGEDVTINGTVYNDGNRSGVERLLSQGSNGCDSLLTVTIDFFPRAEGSISPQVCEGDCILINGTNYCEGNPNGIERLPNAAANGCDSFLVVSLVILPIPQGGFSTTLCPGDSITINGTVYNNANRTGTETLSGSAANGCDSILNVSISYFDSIEYNLTGSLCFGESIMVNGTTYNELNRTGTEVLENQAANGCDSIVYIDLDFTNFAASLINPTLCDGGSITVNAHLYDQSRPTGKDTIIGGSSSGCDSIITIDLTFHPPAEFTLDPTLCPDEAVVVNGTTYDIGNPSGDEVLIGQSSSACDSTIYVRLNFHSAASGTFNPTLCPGDSITINGTVYGPNRTSGTEFFPNSTANGCDSTLTVMIDFFPEAINTINRTICPGQSLTINGTLYDQNNTSGCDTLFGASANACDSIIKVNITVSPALTGRLDGTYCPDQTFVINGNIYDFSNRTGMETVTSSGGCDSIVTVDLHFFAAAIGTLDETWCEGESVTINGNTYDFNNRTGTEAFPNGSVNGCDSTLTIDLDFFPDATGTFNDTLCEGGSININGTIYDKDNTSGVELLANASVNGCDSSVTISIDFYEAVLDTLKATWCKNQTMIINGTTYGFDNASGLEVFLNAAANGCDSSLMIELDFFPEATAILQESICEGQEYIFDGTTYTDAGVYNVVLKQQAVNGCDSLIELNLSLIDAASIGLADAGSDQLACTEEAPISGNLPTGTSGEWTTLEASTILDPTSTATLVQNLLPGTNTLLWTLSTAACPNYDTDTVLVELEALPEANDDNFILTYPSSSANFDLRENDLVDSPMDWFISLENLPPEGSFELGADEQVLVTPADGFSGSLSFNYLLCSENCPDRCSEALVNIFVESEPLKIDTTVAIPNGFTPNGDGLNDFFVVDMLVTNPEDYPDNELVIFNRWGDIVYTASPYLNDWGGKNLSGQELPQGTYYYVLRLKLAEGLIHKGDVTILK